MSYLATGTTSIKAQLVKAIETQAQNPVFTSPIAAHAAANPEAVMIAEPVQETRAGLLPSGLPVPLILVGVAVAAGVFFLWRSRRSAA